ncbi:MAG: hypothetical protein QG583_10 [Patescibacteria group bacterium]|jgi:hypothetical protein|nr:hypothetical protein [Patescibacteria group bacterium]MDQ5954083.1 hypothetical protein [Patescibacteria group bacterium]
MKLSVNAIKDLRISLQKSYGPDFDADFTDEEINKIGLLLLVSLVEVLKKEVVNRD